MEDTYPVPEGLDAIDIKDGTRICKDHVCLSNNYRVSCIAYHGIAGLCRLCADHRGSIARQSRAVGIQHLPRVQRERRVDNTCHHEQCIQVLHRSDLVPQQAV